MFSILAISKKELRRIREKNIYIYINTIYQVEYEPIPERYYGVEPAP